MVCAVVHSFSEMSTKRNYSEIQLISLDTDFHCNTPHLVDKNEREHKVWSTLSSHKMADGFGRVAPVSPDTLTPNPSRRQIIFDKDGPAYDLIPTSISYPPRISTPVYSLPATDQGAPTVVRQLEQKETS